MLKIKKVFPFSAMLLIFTFINIGIARALEVPLLGLPDNPTLPQYVTFLFSWAISIAGALAVISFAIGAVGYLISLDSAEIKSNSVDRMKSAILGLLLILASFLILNTINPALVTPTIEPLPAVAPAPPPPPQPGVYFCLGGCSGNTCSGAMSGPFNHSQTNIDAPFAGNIKGVVIIDDRPNNLWYGVIFHKEMGLDIDGPCSKPIINASLEDECIPVNIPASAADIFVVSRYPETAGDGVTFYSQARGWQRITSGKFVVSADEILTYKVNSDSMCFDYKGVVGQPDTYEKKCGSAGICPDNESPDGIEGQDCSVNACASFQDCPGSIEIKGDYLVAFYNNSENYCQTFYTYYNSPPDDQGVPNLDIQGYIASGTWKSEKNIIRIFSVESD